jgi:hypothetical protein
VPQYRRHATGGLLLGFCGTHQVISSNVIAIGLGRGFRNDREVVSRLSTHVPQVSSISRVNQLTDFSRRVWETLTQLIRGSNGGSGFVVAGDNDEPALVKPGGGSNSPFYGIVVASGGHQNPADPSRLI